MALINRVLIRKPEGDDFLFGFRADGVGRSASRERTKDGNDQDFVVDQPYELFVWKDDDLFTIYAQQVFRFNPDRTGDYLLGGPKNTIIQTLTINYTPNPPGGPAFEFGFNEDGSDRSVSRLRTGDGQGKPLTSGTAYTIFVWQAGIADIYDHETFIFDPDNTGNGTTDFTGHVLKADNLALWNPDLLTDVDVLIGWQDESGRLGRISADYLYRLGLGSKKVTYTQGNPGQVPYRKILTLPADSLAAFDGAIVRAYGGGWGADQKTHYQLTCGNRGGFTASHQTQGKGGFIALLAHQMPTGETTIYLQFLSAFGSALVSVDGIGLFLDHGFTPVAQLPAGGTVIYNTAVNPALLRVSTDGNTMGVKLDVTAPITGTKLKATTPTEATEVFWPVQWNPVTKEFERVSLALLAAALEDPESVSSVDPGGVDPGGVEPGGVDPEGPYSACTSITEQCSGNTAEVRSMTIEVPEAGNYSLVLHYRAWEKAVNGFVKVNDVAQPVLFAQVSQFTEKLIGVVALNEGDNTIALSSGADGGIICFNKVCVTESVSVDPGTVTPVELNGVAVFDLLHGITNGYKIATRLTVDAPGWPEHMQDCTVGELDRYIGTGSLLSCLVVAGYDRCESSQNTQVGFHRYAASLKRMRELGRSGTMKLLVDAKALEGSGQGVIIGRNLKKNGQLTGIARANGVDFLVTGTDNGGGNSGVYALNATWKSLAWLVINLDADTVTLENYSGGTVGTVDPGGVDPGSVEPGEDEDVDMPGTDYAGTAVTTSARVHLDTNDRLAPRPQGNHYDLAPQQAKFVINTNRFPQFAPSSRFVKIYDGPMMASFSEFDLRKFGFKYVFPKPGLRTSSYFTEANLPKANRAAFYGDSYFYNAANDWADDYKSIHSVDEDDDVVIRLRALASHRMVIHQTTIDFIGDRLWADILTQSGQNNGCDFVSLDFETDLQASVESHAAGNDNYQWVDAYKMMGLLYKRVGLLSTAAGKLCKPFTYGVELVVVDQGTDQLKLSNYFTGPNPADPYGSSTHPLIQALATYGGYVGNDKYPRETWSNDSWYNKTETGTYVKSGGVRVTCTEDLTGQLYGQTYSFKGIDNTSPLDYNSRGQKEADYVLTFPYDDLRIIQGYMKAFNNNVVPRRYNDRLAMFVNVQMCRWIREVSEPVYSPGHDFGERPLNPDQATLIKLYRSTYGGDWTWSSRPRYDQGANGGGGVSALGAVEYFIYAEQRASNLLNKFWAAHSDYYYIFPLECKTGFKLSNPNLTYAQANPFWWGIGEGRDFVLGGCYLAQDVTEQTDAVYWYNDGSKQSPGYKARLKGRQSFFELTKLPATITNFDPRYLFIQWTDINGTLRTVSGDWRYPVSGNPTPPALINGTGFETGGGSVSGGSVSGGSVSGGSVSGGSVSGGTVGSGSEEELTRGYITNHYPPGAGPELTEFLGMVDEGISLGLNAVRISVRIGEWIKRNGNTAQWDAQANLARSGNRELPIYLQIIIGFNDDEFTPWCNAGHCQMFMDGTRSLTKFPSLEFWRSWATGVGYDQTNPVWYIEPVLRQIVDHFGAAEVSIALAESVEFAYSHRNGGPKGINDISGYEPRAHVGLSQFSGGQYTTIPSQPTWGAIGEYIFDTFGNDGVGKWAVAYRGYLLEIVKNWLIYCLSGTGARSMMDVGGWIGSQQLLVGTGNIVSLSGGIAVGKGNSMPAFDWRLQLDYMSMWFALIDQELDFSLFNHGGNFWEELYGNGVPVPRVVTEPSQVGVYTNLRRHLTRGKGRGISFFGAGPQSKNELFAAISAVADLLGQPVAARTGASGTVPADFRKLRKNEGLLSKLAWEQAGAYEHPVNFQFIPESLS